MSAPYCRCWNISLLQVFNIFTLLQLLKYHPIAVVKISPYCSCWNITLLQVMSASYCRCWNTCMQLLNVCTLLQICLFQLLNVCTLLQIYLLQLLNVCTLLQIFSIAVIKCLHPTADISIAVVKCLHPTVGPVQQPGAGARQGGEHAHHPLRHQASAVSIHHREREKRGSMQVVISVSVGCWSVNRGCFVPFSHEKISLLHSAVQAGITLIAEIPLD